MRILIISEITGYMRGGVPAETTQLVSGLSARGHQVALMSDLPIGRDAAVSHFPLALPIDRSFGGKVSEAVGSFRPDLVHVVAMGSRGISLVSRKLDSIPWLFTCHSVPPYERKLSHLHGNEALHYAARAARFALNAMAWRLLFRSGIIPQVIVHSENLAQIVEHYGQSKRRMSVIPLGIDVEQFTPPVARYRRDKTVRLATVAGIAHTKGQHDVLLALATLQSSALRFEYTIVGEIRDESYMRFLQKMIRNLKLNGTVRFRLNATESEKKEVLQTTDIYVQPSHEEGFCLAFLEAAIVAPILIGTDVGAIRAISAHDDLMRVVPAKQPLSIANAIREFSGIEPASELLKSRRQRLRETFSWPTYIDAHEMLYAQLEATVAK